MKYLICFFCLFFSSVMFANPDRPLPPLEGSINNFYSSVILSLLIIAWCFKLYLDRRKLMKAGLYRVDTVYNYDPTKTDDNAGPSFLDISINNKITTAKKVR